MSKSWPMVTLGKLLKQTRREIKVDSTVRYDLLGARWYALGLYIKDHKFGTEIKADKLYRVEEGDFVYNRLFAWKGSFAVAGKLEHDCYVSNEFPCFEVDRSQLDPEFLWRYFSLEKSWNESLGLSSGATPTSRNRLKESKLLSMKIPLPPLAEQKRIVAKIGELAAKIEEARRLRRQAVDEVEAFVTSLHSKLAGSRIKKLGDILRLEEDTVPIKPTDSYPQVGVRGFGGGLFPKPAISGMDTTYKIFNRLYEGAFVMSQVKAWEGAVAVCSGELDGMYVSPEYRTFRFLPSEADPEYFSAIVKTEWFWSRLKDATRGVGARRERTRPEQFLNIEIPVPTVVQQRESAILFDKIESLKSHQAETAAELDAMLPSILAKSFQGTL